MPGFKRKGKEKKPAKQLTPEQLRRKAARKAAVPKIVLCLVLLVVLAALPAFVNTAIGYIPVITYVLLIVLSFIYVKVLERSLEISTNKAGDGCVRGDAINFSLTVKNKSIFPAVRIQALFYMSDLFGEEGHTDVHNVALGPRREQTFDFGIRFDHIGTYHVGIKEVVILDLFGLFSATKYNDRLTEVNVQPRIFDVATLNLTKDAAVEAKKNFSAVINEGMDYSGVREYRWGDPIKAIHWKLSASAPDGEYYTRLYETNANPGMAIVAGFDAPLYSNEELMGVYDAIVEVTFSLARFAEANSVDAEIAFQGKDKTQYKYRTPMTGRNQEALDRMPRIQPSGKPEELLSLVTEESGSLFAESNLIVCTSLICKELVDTLVAVKTGKRSPMLFAVVPEGMDAEEEKKTLAPLKELAALDIPYTVISSATVLEQEY